MARPKKNIPTVAKAKVPTYEGVKQVGDASLFDDQNAAGAETMTHRSEVAVYPNDLVYKADPTKRFKFALFDPKNPKARSVLTRWRRKGYERCLETDWVSPTERFDVYEGAWCYDDMPWYAIPIERYRDNRRERAERIGNVTEQIEALQGDIDDAGDGQVTSFATVDQRTGVRRA